MAAAVVVPSSMMDRDYPITPRQWKVTAAALGAAGIAGILLFGGLIPGLHPNYTTSPLTTLDGRSYYWRELSVPIPWPGTDRTKPTEGSFHNVTFWTWVTNWSILGGTYYHGNASEPNGTVYAFVLGSFRDAANWTGLYVAPGGAIAVEWAGGTTAYLLVLA